MICTKFNVMYFGSALALMMAGCGAQVSSVSNPPSAVSPEAENLFCYPDQEWEPELEIPDSGKHNPPAFSSQEDTLPTAKCPNVALIIIDTLRADKLGCYGCWQDTSPALDVLAAQGVQFEHVLAQCSWTRPSISSFLTSQYPRTLGLYKEENEILDDRWETLAEVLRDNGYYTLGLTANPIINSAFNMNQGFDEYLDSGVVFRGMSVPDGSVTRGEAPLPSARELFDKAIAHLKSPSAAQQPVYLQINLMEVHEWATRRPGADLMRPEYDEFFRNVRGGPFVKYLRMVRQATDDVGGFVARLSALPGWDDALFIILADHGEGLNDHPAVQISEFHGRLLYESSLSVPWIMYRKGWRPKQPAITQEVRLLDVMPTLLDYLGLPAPKGMAGVSLMPWINGEDTPLPIPEIMVAETHFRTANKIAAYGRKWKYIRSSAPHPGIAADELQPRTRMHENGVLTNQAAKQPRATRILRDYLERWEKAHPKAPATPMQNEATETTRKQIEAIGYLQ